MHERSVICVTYNRAKAKAGAIKDSDVRSVNVSKLHGAPDCRASMVGCTWPTALVDLLHIAHSNISKIMHDTSNTTIRSNRAHSNTTTHEAQYIIT